MATASPPARTEVSVTFSNPPTPNSSAASNASIGSCYTPDFGEVYVRGNKCIAPNKRRTRCGHTNVSTSEEQEELKPWAEKSEQQRLLHRYCPLHRKEAQRELAERTNTPGSNNTERPHRPDLVSPPWSIGRQPPGGMAPAAHNIQALYPDMGDLSARASHPNRHATSTDIGGSSMHVGESQPGLPPLPTSHTASASGNPHQSVLDPMNMNSEVRVPPNLPYHYRDPSFSLSPNVSEAQMRREIAEVKAEEAARNRDQINNGTSTHNEAGLPPNLPHHYGDPSLPFSPHVSESQMRRENAGFKAEEVARNHDQPNSGARLPENRIDSTSGNGHLESFNVPGNYYHSTGHDSRPPQSHHEPAPQNYSAPHGLHEMPLYQHSSIPTSTSYRPPVTHDGRCINGRCITCRREALIPLHTKINRNYNTIHGLEENLRVLHEENKALLQRMMSLSLGTDERARG